MAGNDRAARAGQHLCHALVAAMGNVDDHPDLFHPAQDLASERGQPGLGYPVERSGELVVEEVSQPGHPEPGGVEFAEVFGFAFEVVEPFDREQRTDRAVRLVRGQQPVKAGLVADLEQLAARRFHCAIKLLPVPQRAFEQRGPGPARLQLGDRQQGDVIAVAAVRIVVLALGRLGGGREHLQRDIAFLQPGQVFVAAIRQPGHIAAPQQGVGMQVDHQQALVQCLGLGADRDQVLAVDPVHVVFEVARRNPEKPECRQRHRRNWNPNPFAHLPRSLSPSPVYAAA